MIKNSPANAGDVGLPLGWEDPLEKEPIPVFLPGKSHGQRILGGLQSMDSQESGATKQQQSVLYHHL